MIKPTHQLTAVHFPDVRREGFEEVDQTILRLPQHIQCRVGDRLAGQRPVKHEALWGVPRKHMPGDIPDQLVYLKDMVHPRRSLVT